MSPAVSLADGNTVNVLYRHAHAGPETNATIHTHTETQTHRNTLRNTQNTHKQKYFECCTVEQIFLSA